MVSQDRESTIVRTSLIGVLTNVGLAAVKAFIGIITGSIAVTMDAVNNLSDALSSTVTIAGTKLSMRPPDRKHPFGYGRIEYMTALVVAVIVLYAGVTALLESGEQIFSPVDTEYSAVSLFVIVIAIFVKIILGRYTVAVGRRVDSGALRASGADAMFDAVLSTSVLVSALIMVFTDISLEAYVGVLISLFIIKAGLEMMGETIGEILGQRSDPEITSKVKGAVMETPGVMGVYDLVMTDYGPGRDYASVHVEVDSSMTAEEIDVMSRNMQVEVQKKTGVVITAVGVYSKNNSDPEVMAIRDRVMEITSSHEWVLQTHAFHVDIENRTMRFDVVLSFGIDRSEAIEKICSEVLAEYPGYKLTVAPDVDVSD